MYRIKYTYDTGDSFRTESGVESTLEFSWKNIEIAKANLTRIKEHYELYKELGYSNFEEQQAQLKNAAKNDWFASRVNSKEKSKHPS